MFPILTPPPPFPIPSLWVVLVHQPQASSIMHRTWTGDLFHIWHYTCFNAILPNHPTLSLSHRVQKTVLYICVSFANSYSTISNTCFSLVAFMTFFSFLAMWLCMSMNFFGFILFKICWAFKICTFMSFAKSGSF